MPVDPVAAGVGSALPDADGDADGDADAGGAARRSPAPAALHADNAMAAVSSTAASRGDGTPA